ncbi:MAG: Flp pilus assembly complex ATPase component TadA [Phycisphaerales bacterium]|nr:Flp pilus assembly complex ATPase component TadA [Planctomycetota bacterium]MBL6997637.1 Flp pilus assembly complex ATPase component TadA [Phycisphaerales bacterium]
MARKLRRKIGEILLEEGLITREQLDAAIAAASGTTKKVGEVLQEQGICDEKAIVLALANQFGMTYLALDGSDDGPEPNLDLIPKDVIQKHSIIPLAKKNDKLQLVIHDPMNLELLDLLRFRLNCELEPVLSTKTAIQEYISKETGTQGSIISDTSLVTDSVDVSVDRSVDKSVDSSIDVDDDQAPVVKLVSRFITEAVRNRTSDIHLEPMEDRVVLRYRIDGVCHVRDNLPKRMQAAVLARLKLMAGVNIAEKRIPQDGRIKMEVDAEQIDFRVSACPAYHGESVVLRILRPDSVRIGLKNIGFEQENFDSFNKLIRKPNGILLVTGPTGSGKTTTLYSALDILNRPDRKIITAEDPIEYSFAGINQCQVRESIGLTFSSILRAMLRQAPNVILIGEIRDREVADIAIQAALTGHLVFSTLHTNDAPSAITRLIDMGVKPYLVASSIQAIMAQRLIRLLCTDCKAIDDNPDKKFLRIVGISDDEVATGAICKAVGCSKCGGLGYRGRKAIFEMMVMNNEIRELAFNRAPLGQIRQAGIRAGMRTLVEDGKIKILRGDTTPEEIARFAQAEALLEGNVDI